MVIEIKDLPDDDLPETMLAVATASEKRLRTFRERLCDFATPFLKPGAKPSPRRLPEWDLEGLPDVPREQIAVANASRKRSEETAAQAVAQVPLAASPTDSSAKPKATTLLERVGSAVDVIVGIRAHSCLSFPSRYEPRSRLKNWKGRRSMPSTVSVMALFPKEP